MYEQVEKPKENKSRAVANSVTQKKSGVKQAFGFVDNRPEAIQMRKQQMMADNYSTCQQQPIQNKENNTGLPGNLKSGIENLSGYSMDDVKVHYNSDKPAQLHAHAYAQGTDIHLASGQEKYLPHEAWHVVQQKQGRVKPTMHVKGKVNVNDDVGLEKEADVMGGKAFQMKENSDVTSLKQKETNPSVIQAKMGVEYETGIRAFDNKKAQAMIGKKIEEEKTFPPQAEWALDNPKYREIVDLFAQHCYVGQDETMWNGAGWQIDSDNSKLEFVTEPAVPFKDFSAPLKGLVNAVKCLPDMLKTPIPLGPFAGAAAGPFSIFPYKAKDQTLGRITGNRCFSR